MTLTLFYSFLFLFFQFLIDNDKTSSRKNQYPMMIKPFSTWTWPTFQALGIRLRKGVSPLMRATEFPNAALLVFKFKGPPDQVDVFVHLYDQ